jgi:hypothetical protein
MAHDWDVLTKLTEGARFVVERVRILDTGIAIEGSFDAPPLACLSPEDQVFVAAFIHSHGSIKHMEELFGVSYPTVKNRLNRVAGQLDFVEVKPAPRPASVLDELESGEISVVEALRRLDE